MTKIAKLYQKLLDRRSLKFSEFCRLMEAFGYRRVRSTGSHIAYEHAAIVQPRGSDAKPYQVRQFMDRIEEFGLTLGESND